VVFRRGVGRAVSPFVGEVPGLLVDDFADRCAGGGLVDQVLAGGERGDQCLQGQVVDRAGKTGRIRITPSGLVDR
jgi:hypothetical protein